MQRVRLALADLGRERDRIEPLEQPDLGEQLSHQRRRVEGVRDQADLEPVRSQRVDQLDDGRLEVMRGRQTRFSATTKRLTASSSPAAPSESSSAAISAA